MLRIFVYGTLMRGEVNHHLLDRARFLEDARTRESFELHDFGAFPVLVRGGTRKVSGELYAVDDGTLSELDRLEGHPHFYRRSEIELEQGLAAEAYLLDQARALAAPPIESGSWRAHARAQRHFRVRLSSGEELQGDASEVFGALHARGIGVGEIVSLDLV
jgi:gamma-glutamylaminecyclotransferase